MRKICTIILTIVTIHVYGQDTKKDLYSEMARLETETVLIVQSEGIDEYPMWSPNSNFVACNIQGKWYKFRLTNIELTTAKWREQNIGVLATKDAFSELTAKEQLEFENVSTFNPREVKTEKGTTIELKMEGMFVSLLVTKKGEEAKKLWTSGGENCHSLVLSPDENFVAYLCELNGLLIMKLE